ncbi:SURF1 family protein [Demequina sediminicola]|uniref:SURF1 family protein n=1 Tax=Demequina sediminicola TaxID=1095026 RepID=UPI000B197AA1|nr:SURF1 family protein [Demequina sediminicola]
MIFRGLSPVRVIVTLGVAVAISAVAIVLGDWQHGRHEAKTDARDAYAAAQEEPVAPLEVVVPPGSTDLPESAQWRTVTVTGVFDSETATVLRGRPIDSTPAWQYLAWLDTDSGESVLVSVGWIPQPGPNEDPVAVPYSDQVVTVTGVVREWEEDDGKSADDSVSRITPAQLDEPHHPAVPGYLMMREYCDDSGCRNTLVGQEVPLPELSVGPHLSYAWQWWVFAALAPLGAVLLLRRDSREQALIDRRDDASGTGPAHPPNDLADDTPASTPSPAPTSAVSHTKKSRRQRRRGPSDEEIEDAL